MNINHSEIIWVIKGENYRSHRDANPFHATQLPQTFNVICKGKCLAGSVFYKIRTDR